MPAGRRSLGIAALVVVLALVVAGIAWSRSHRSGPAGRTTNQTGVPPTPTPSVAGLGPLAPSVPGATPHCGGGDCGIRLAAAAAAVRTGPGRLGVTVLDRRTSAVWEAGTAARPMWASSTPKLALATSLLERARAGEITLDPTARTHLAAMLAVSDDAAADALWDRYGGASLLPASATGTGCPGRRSCPASRSGGASSRSPPATCAG